jgi:hypothetical protein
MSSMFDTLLNSYATRGLFGETALGSINLDEYEKSVYLTQAQDIIVKSYFDKTLNPQGQGFDDSARRQVDFSSLIKVENINLQSGSTSSKEYHSVTKIWGGINDDFNSGNHHLGDITITNKTANDLTVVLETISGTFLPSGVSSGFTDATTIQITLAPEASGGLTMAELMENIQNAYCQGNPLSDYLEVSFEEGDEDDSPNTGITATFGTIAGYTETYTTTGGFDDRGYIYKMPSETVGEQEISKVLFILNEKLIAHDGYGDKTDFVIVPINYQEYDREMSKAYAQPLKKQAWRLFQNIETGFDIYSELIPRFDTDMTGAIYRVRYVRRPKPIVLSNLDGLSIEGETDESSCELNPILHMDIIQKAVELVYATRGTRTSSNNS